MPESSVERVGLWAGAGEWGQSTIVQVLAVVPLYIQIENIPIFLLLPLMYYNVFHFKLGLIQIVYQPSPKAKKQKQKQKTNTVQTNLVQIYVFLTSTAIKDEYESRGEPVLVQIPRQRSQKQKLKYEKSLFFPHVIVRVGFPACTLLSSTQSFRNLSFSHLFLWWPLKAHPDCMIDAGLSHEQVQPMEGKTWCGS